MLHVPLVLAGAGIRAGARGAVRQVDVASTLSALLGLAVPSSNQGRPLLDALDLDPRSAGCSALRAVLEQRERFVAAYVHRLAPLGIAALPTAVPAARSPRRRAVADEAWVAARLDALDRREAAAPRRRRRVLETKRARAARRWSSSSLRSRLGACSSGSRIVGGGELRRAVLAAAARPRRSTTSRCPSLGLRYSITAVNKDEWLPGFFRKDMALGVAVPAPSGVAAGRVARAPTSWRARSSTSPASPGW